jgi:erythromycin esterase-like protein
MGQFIHEQLGNQVYTIGFTAYDGTAGSWLARPFEVSVPPDGTLEDICQKAGLVNGMIALNPVDDKGKWLTKKIYARPLGYSWMRANWCRHFDAMVFNKTMSPSSGR